MCVVSEVGLLLAAADEHALNGLVVEQWKNASRERERERDESVQELNMLECQNDFCVQHTGHTRLDFFGGLLLASYQLVFSRAEIDLVSSNLNTVENVLDLTMGVTN
jgi:hypothetical protein